MEVLGFTVLCSTIVYCVMMIHMQRVNLDFHRDEEIKRLKDKIKELEAQMF